ncbi:helix-turn-helix transcriptional regulator [Terrabacter sp. NPDC080008]|uniref:PadR family transcriptional regulator n=1 Tax=Terrabacter sp. NPDC080008 TaxID=3155176 RepID=UPI003450416A
MGNKPRMTVTTVEVLQTFADDASSDRYGLEIMALTGLPSGTVFPILARFEGLGWLESGWEDVDPAVVGRPQRRYYRLTGKGVQLAESALAQVARAREKRRSVLRPVPGSVGFS